MLIATESLTRMDKLRLIEQIWEELSRETEPVESPAWHAEALAETEKAIARGVAGFIAWEEAKERLRQGGA